MSDRSNSSTTTEATEVKIYPVPDASRPDEIKGYIPPPPPPQPPQQPPDPPTPTTNTDK